MSRHDIEIEIALQNEIERQHENQGMARNLKRIDRLSRHGLLVFLDLEHSKSNTERLRKRARLIAIEQSWTRTDDELTHAENTL